MTQKIDMKIIKKLPLILIVFAVLSCNTSQNNDDAKKLLEQSQVKTEKPSNSDDSAIGALEMDQQKVRSGRLQLTRDSLQYELNKVNGSVNELMVTINQMMVLQDSLSNSNDVLNSVDKNAENSLSKGIAEIDERLSQLERQELKSEQIVKVSKKRIELIDRKLDVLSDEIQLLEDDKTIALRNRDSDKRHAIESEISLIKMQIQTEQEKSAKAAKDVENHQSKILDLAGQQNELQSRIGKDYDAQLLVDDFMESEKERVQIELEKIQSRLMNVEKNREVLAQRKALLENQLMNVDAKINDLSRKQLSQLNRKLSNELNVEEQVSNESTSDLSDNTQLLLEANDSPNELEDNIRGSNPTIPIIIGIVILFIIILFIVGKQKRTKQANKK